MVIREILDVYDRAIAHSRNQQKLLEEAKARVLACCKQEESPNPVAGRIGCEDAEPKRKRRKAA